MFPSSSKERLRLTHQLLDRELQNNSFTRPSHTHQTSSSQIARSKNVQSEISELQRKLMDLEKKMENIDVSSSNQGEDDEAGIGGFGIGVGKKSIGGGSVGGKQKDRGKQERDRGKEFAITRVGNKIGNGFSGHRKIAKDQGNQSDEQDSGDDGQIYAKIISEKQKKKIRAVSNEKQKQKVKKNQEPPAPRITVNKQPMIKSVAPKTHHAPSAESYLLKKPSPDKPQPSSSHSRQKQKQKPKNNPLRNSVKSVQSSKSKKSIKSIASNSKISHNSKLQHSTSKKSLTSNPNHGGLSTQQYHQLQLQNAKDIRRITNLQKELNHYKRLCARQQEKIQEYRVMEIEFRKLQGNFGKSQQIRKQQKKIIQNLKSKN